MGEILEIIADERKPVELMTKTDKIRTVKILDDRGAFLIRGLVQIATQVFNVSRYTLYNDRLKVRGDSYG